MKYKGGERGGDGDHPEQACPQPQKVGHQLQHHLGPAGEAAGWVQHHQPVVQIVSPRKISHHVHPWGRHPQQEEGAFLVMQTQEEAHLGSQGKEALAQSIF